MAVGISSRGGVVAAVVGVRVPEKSSGNGVLAASAAPAAPNGHAGLENAGATPLPDPETPMRSDPAAPGTTPARPPGIPGKPDKVVSCSPAPGGGALNPKGGGSAACGTGGVGHPNADGVVPGTAAGRRDSSTAARDDAGNAEPERMGLACAGGANAFWLGVEWGAAPCLDRRGDPASSSEPWGSEGCACASGVSVMGGSSRVV
jgi:hypothetical protein